LRYWNEHEAHESFQFLHTLVEDICERYPRIYLEDFVSQLDPRSYKRKVTRENTKRYPISTSLEPFLHHASYWKP